MESLLNILGKIGDQFIERGPKIALALFLLIFGWILAKIVERALRKILVAIKVDDLSEKLNDVDIFQKINLRFSTILSRLAYYGILLIFLAATANSIELDIVSSLINDAIKFIPKLIVAAGIFVFGTLMANFIKNIVAATFKSVGIPSGKLIAAFIFYFLLIALAITALEQLDVPTDFISNSAYIILGGAILAFGIGYGYASRDVLANILASTYSKKKFSIGDTIKVGDLKGEIIDMDGNSVTLSSDDRHIIIPQKKLAIQEVELFKKD